MNNTYSKRRFEIMKKGLLAFLLVALLTICAAFPAMAASGLNSSEEDLYNYFKEQVNSKSWLSKELKTNYLSESENALTKVDLDAAACKDLKGAVDAVMKILNDNKVSSLKEAQKFHDDFLAAVNPVAGKYNMKVELDYATGVAKVYVNGSVVADTKSTVNQTGFGTAQTVALSAVIAIAAAGAFIVIRRRNLAA